MIFYLLPIISFLLFLMNKLGNNTSKHLNLGLFFLIITISIVGMFRGKGIGTDYYAYESIFIYEDGIEYLFLQLIKLIKFLEGNYRFFISLIFAISFYIKLFLFKRMSLNPLLSLMIYLGFWFLVYDMNGIRQGLALSFTLLATYNIWKKNIKFYWFYTIVAVLIHASSIVFVPFIYIISIKPSLRRFFIAIIFSFLLSINGGFIGIMDYILSLIGFETLNAKLFSYSINDNFNNNILFSFTTIHRFFIVAVLYYYIPRMKCDDRMKNIFIWAATLNIIIYLLFSNIEIVATRMSLFYRFIECISLACIPSVFLQNKNQIIAALLLIIYVLSQTYATLSVDNNYLVPFYLNI